MVTAIRFYIKAFCFLLLFNSILFNNLGAETLSSSISAPVEDLKSNKDFFTHSFSININDLLIRRYILNYTTIYKDQTYFDFSLGYRYCGPVTLNDEDDLLSYNISEMTSINYNQFTVRAGLKYYNFERIFFGVMFNYNYDYNKNMKIKYGGDYGLYSSRKNEFGALLKFGVILFKSNHFMSELYFGMGLLESFKKEVNYDPEYSHWLEPTFHFGLTIGLKY